MLLLGGTGEARDLAGRLAARIDLSVILSLAGRTERPAAQPVPARSGGFGGVAGLVRYLADARIAAVVDATHPYADTISRHAALACAEAGVPRLVLRRAPWAPLAGDRWHTVADVADAITALGASPRRVFLAIGRNAVRGFEAAPQHAYLVRSVDPVTPPLAVPDAGYLTARGPFALEDELALLRMHRIDAVVAKNSGGPATYAKIAAARRLGIEVLMLRRPDPPPGAAVACPEAAIVWLDALVARRCAG
ncbi:precorrin-6A reductase [Aquabacter spiritensis]|uniref:Precorrin-6A reductase n=1 Tax=Aquabacter spiritensis TaxID=933073 RepID=A0A4R3M522_9HYPH|nr:precorrin-6A reductase [Aquabacter spiritensis]